MSKKKKSRLGCFTLNSSFTHFCFFCVNKKKMNVEICGVTHSHSDCLRFHKTRLSLSKKKKNTLQIENPSICGMSRVIT